MYPASGPATNATIAAISSTDPYRFSAVAAIRGSAQFFAIGVLVGHETDWLPRATTLLSDALLNTEIKVSSGFSTTLAADLQSGLLDAAFLRHEPDTGLAFRLVETEPLVAILPSDHRLAAKNAPHPSGFASEIVISAKLRAAVW